MLASLSAAISRGVAVVGIFLFSLAASIGIIWFLLKSGFAWRVATDVPNYRSLHNRPIPRVGGWGVVPAVLASGIIFDAFQLTFVVVAISLFILSYADDRRGLPIVVRLPMHAAAAAAWLAYGPVQLSLIIAGLAAFAIVWVTNLFNFMDGSDGLAGGMAVFAFSVYAVVAAATGVEPLAMWSIAFAGSAAGFLLFNFNPARVFLGDAGSVTLGFFAGAFGIWGWAVDAWPVWFPFLVSAPFFLDATVTILRRMARGVRFWEAHREHYYQRLIRSGWSHRRTALCEYAMMALSSGLAVAMLKWSEPAQYAALAGVGLVYFALATAIDRRWATYQLAVPSDEIDETGARGTQGSSIVLTQPAVSCQEALPVESRMSGSRQGVAHRSHTAADPGARRYDEPAFQREGERAGK